MAMLTDAVLALQCFHVLFLALHDWIPLGRLSDVQAVRAENSRGKLIAATLISTAPFAAVLAASAFHLGRSWPHWLLLWLLASYAFLFVGELEAWWTPYFFGAKPERVVRYAAMFGRTHAFLPARNGIRVNTLHVILHAATLAILVLLAILRLH